MRSLLTEESYTAQMGVSSLRRVDIYSVPLSNSSVLHVVLHLGPIFRIPHGSFLRRLHARKAWNHQTTFKRSLCRTNSNSQRLDDRSDVWCRCLLSNVVACVRHYIHAIAKLGLKKLRNIRKSLSLSFHVHTTTRNNEPFVINTVCV